MKIKKEKEQQKFPAPISITFEKEKEVEAVYVFLQATLDGRATNTPEQQKKYDEGSKILNEFVEYISAVKNDE